VLPKCDNLTKQRRLLCRALISFDSLARENAVLQMLCRSAAHPLSRCVVQVHACDNVASFFLQLLVESQQWATDVDLPSLTNPCTVQAASADLRIIGFDQHHRPVIYSSMLMVSSPLISPRFDNENSLQKIYSFTFSLQRNTSMRNPDQTQLNTTCIMAKAASCTSDGCPSNCTWVNNFNGFSVTDLNPMFAIKAAKVRALCCCCSLATAH
jgi:hypothetical protein